MNSTLDQNLSTLKIRFFSFGYKYGVPNDANFVFDCRELPNPFWVKELKNLTGLDKEVVAFFEDKKEVADYIDQIQSFLAPTLSRFAKSGRENVSIYFGCTGGQHRSAYIANAVYEHFKKQYDCSIFHRDLDKRGELQ